MQIFVKDCFLAHPVILLQIVMVSFGTHPVKNHKSQSRSDESQFKKQGVMLGPLCNQTVNLETDSKLFITVY